MSLSFWPATPPLALMSAPAISAPRRICSPTAASEPLIGPATAMTISARAWAAARAAKAAAAKILPRKRMKPPPVALPPRITAECCAGLRPAFEIGGAHLCIGEQFLARSRQGDLPGLQYIAAMGEVQGVMR